MSNVGSKITSGRIGVDKSVSLNLCRHAPDSHRDTHSTSRCRRFLDSSHVSPADLVSYTRGGGGHGGRATSGDGFDTARVASAVSCFTLLEVSWLLVSEREHRRFTFGVSKRERRGLHSSLVSATRFNSVFLQRPTRPGLCTSERGASTLEQNREKSQMFCDIHAWQSTKWCALFDDPLVMLLLNASCHFGILRMCPRKCFPSSHVDKDEVLKPCETRDQIVPVFETTTLHRKPTSACHSCRP